MSMHVLQLGPYPPPEGGVTRNMLAIRDELIKRGDDCSIIATTRSSRVGEEPNIYHPRSARQVLALLRSIEFDLLHLHIGGNVSNRMLGLAFAATFFAGKRSVLTIHSGAFPLTVEAKSAKRFSARGAIFRRFGRIIVVNDDLADVFARYGCAKHDIRKVLPFSLQLPDENIPIPASLAGFVAAHSPLLLSVGGLEQDYDPVFQIEAMSDILQEFPKAGLMIVGDGSMRSEVESAIAVSGYAQSIRVAGNVEHAVTLHLIDQADILLRTTLFDGDAISIREALFLGTPVIATDNGMRPDAVHLIDIGDRVELVKKIRELASSEKMPSATATPDDENIKRVVEIYQELL